LDQPAPPIRAGRLSPHGLSVVAAAHGAGSAPGYAHHPQGRRRAPRRAHCACPDSARTPRRRRPGGPASPVGARGPHPHASAWQRQPPRLMGGAGARGVGGAPRYTRESPCRNGRHREGPARQPPAPQGVPAGGTAPGVPQRERGCGRGLTQPPSTWRGQAGATGRRGLASPGERRRSQRASQPWRCADPGGPGEGAVHPGWRLGAPGRCAEARAEGDRGAGGVTRGWRCGYPPGDDRTVLGGPPRGTTKPPTRRPALRARTRRGPPSMRWSTSAPTRMWRPCGASCGRG
jgi:hypothetical protein